MIRIGNCLEVMPTLPAEHFDSIVTDPPYGLSFMGKGWDHAVPGAEFWLEALRVAKPGAFLAAFGGTRTFHRLACAIEDAGWELRDTLMWVYGSGFPKSHNGPWGGTALKPAWEPIILARKPLIGTVAANHAAYGTGGLDIDGCRVGTGDDRSSGGAPIKNPAGSHSIGGGWTNDRERATGGRWPANLVHDGSDEILAAFPYAPGQQGIAKSDGSPQGNAVYGALRHGTKNPQPRGDAGSAARFFYCAKADRADRESGLDSFAPVHRPNGNKWTDTDYRVSSGERSAARE